jgi:hypothetical protein
MNFLVGLIVVQSLAVASLAVWFCYLVWGRANQSMRYDLDASAQALKMQALIDARVSDRISIASMPVTARRSKPGPGEQPPDPNVRTSSILDDVHEYEREAQRIMGDAEYSKRDLFNQPPAPDFMET